jgi:site-specific DNA recombinase
MERSKLGKLRRAKEGYYSGSANARFGYSYDKATKKITVDEKEAEVVRLAFEFYNQPDFSILKVTRKLRELGYRTKEGHEMREDAVHDILRDSIYIGKWHANKHDSKTGGLKPSKDWILVDVPRIVSDEEFYRAQELLLNRRNYSERNAKYDYLLQGMVKCGDCGNTVAGTADKQVTVKKGKKYGPYFMLYYRCTHFVKNRFDKVVKCKLRYVQARKLEDSVWNEVVKIFQNPDLIEHAVRNKPDVEKLGREAAEKELSRISMLLDSLDKEEHRILEAYRQSIITIEQLREQMDSLRKNRETLERTKQDLTLSLNKEDKREEIKNAIDYVKKIKEGMKQFTYQQKKAVLQLLNTSIKVNIDGKIDIDCFLPAVASIQSKDSFPCIDLPRPILWPSVGSILRCWFRYLSCFWVRSGLAAGQVLFCLCCWPGFTHLWLEENRRWYALRG